MELFKQALEKFNSYQPKTDLDPNWGKSEAEYFVNQAQNKIHFEQTFFGRLSFTIQI